MSETVILIIVGVVLFLVFVWMILFFRKRAGRDVGPQYREGAPRR